MNGPFDKVFPGSPLRIHSAAWNRFLDASQVVTGNTSGDGVGPEEPDRGPEFMLAKNGSGTTIPRYGVAGINGPLFDPTEAPDGFARELYLTGGVPTAGNEGKFAIALEPIPAGKVGRVVASGLAITKVLFDDQDTAYRYADVIAGDSAKLEASSMGSAAIIWHEARTAPGQTKWAIVHVGNYSGESELFPVALAQTGGAAGSPLAAPSWVYTVTNAVTGEELATGVDPTAAPHNRIRAAYGAATAASVGIARMNESDPEALELVWINEEPSPEWAFPVTLEQDGGAKGRPGDAADWTYTVKDARTGSTLATGVDPTAAPHHYQRPESAPLKAATYGLARTAEGDPNVIELVWVNEAVEWERVFPVELSSTGGSDGNAISDAEYTYDVVDPISGVTLASSVDPTASPHQWERPETGQTSPANWGLAVYLTVVDLVAQEPPVLSVLWTNETPDSKQWAFPIDLAQTGGSQWTDGSPASWTYLVTDPAGGGTLATGVDPTAAPHGWRRPWNGPIQPATRGIGTLDSGGLFKIAWTNEYSLHESHAIFALSLTVAASSFGTASTKTAHTYNVSSAATGTLLASGVNPESSPHLYKRPDLGRLTTASAGMGYIDDSGDLVILWVNEALDASAC